MKGKQFQEEGFAELTYFVCDTNYKWVEMVVFNTMTL